MTKRERTQRRGGFTLVEVLIVVVILGILAATVLPQFTAASDDSKRSALVQDLQLLRSQVQMFRFQHEGTLPAAGTSDDTLFLNQLAKKTDLNGTVNETSGKFGPYIIGQLPPNPYTSLRAVKVVNGPLAATDFNTGTGHGWAYSSETGDLRANVVDAITTEDPNDLRPVNQL